MRLIALLILVFTAAFSGASTAQEPPARAGRIAFTEGTVALYQDPDAGWERAYVNSPITSENSVWTDPRSRAEIRISGVVVRLDEATQLDMARVDDDEIDAYVVRGSIAVRVRHAEAQPAYFSTPHAAFRLGGAGRYRIDVDADRDETVFTVFSGAGSMRSGGGEIRVEAGRAIRVSGDNTFVRDTARSDAFDRWTLARDEKWRESRSLRYVSAYMTGYEDLDTYGQWVEEPEYGALWYPARVSSDWVPYRQGHWANVRPWGWTWIADEPWGYAPYHYGRWVYVRNRWGWMPGERIARPVWAPALVAWVGGTNFSVRIGSAATPAVGWYPLAPWERYEPWYRVKPAYATRINVVVRDGPPRNWQGDRRDGRGDRDSWRSYNRERAATVVRRDQFIDRRPVQQSIIPNVTPEVLRQAPVASPNTIFTREDVTRRQRQGQTQLRTPGSPPATTAPVTPGAPVTAGAPAFPQAPSANPQQPSRRVEAGTNYRPNFQRERRNATAPAPAPAPAAAQPAAPSATNPLGRDPRPEASAPAAQQQQQQQRQQQEQQRAAREAQQQQERAAREAQQQQERQGAEQRRAQERAAREAQQQQQERAAREAQQEQQRQQQEQQRAQEQQRQQQERQGAEQRRAQERAAREAQQQQQERAAREAQQAQQRQQQEQQQRQQQEQQRQQQEQQRAAREAAQAQQRQQQEQQQAQQRQQQEQQRAQQEQQRAQQEQQRQQQEQARQQAEQRRAQERAAREAQQQQRQQPPAQPQPAQPQPAQPQAAPPAQPLPPRAAPPQREDKEKEKDKDKDNKGDDKDKENPGKGRGRDR